MTTRRQHIEAQPRFALVITLALTCWGCAIDDGSPWGRLSATASVQWQPPVDRLTAAGELLTVNNEAVALSTIAVKIASVRAVMATTTTDTKFDPANPPPGYSLCHTGHCHKDDGTLPSYEQIKETLAKQGGAVAASITWAVTGQGWLAVHQGAATLELGACKPSCDIGRGKMARWQVDVSALKIAGKVRSTTAKGALSDAPRAFTMTWTAPASIRQPSTLAFDRDAPAGVNAKLSVQLPSTLLDDIDFKTTAVATATVNAPPTDLSSAASATDATRGRLAVDGAIAVDIERFSL